MDKNTALTVVGVAATVAILFISIVYQVKETERECLRTNNCECVIKK